MTTINLLKRKAFLTLGLLLIAFATLSLPALAQSDRPAPAPPQPMNANPSKDNIYQVVEKLPNFPGGVDEFSKFLAQNIKYPAADREKNIVGKVVTQFVVERDGSLSDIKIIRTPSEGMAAEAVRVLSLSPKWIPGMQNGKVVRASYTIPINFSLSKG